jgi:phage shock protein A
MKLKINNFLCHANLELTITKPLTYILAENSRGKTSIADALEWLYTGVCRGITKGHYDAVITKGATAASVSLDNYWRKQTSTGSQNSGKVNQSANVPEIPSACFNGFNFLRANFKEKSAMVNAVSGGSRITPELLQAGGIPKSWLARIQNFEKARKDAEKERQEANGAIKALEAQVMVLPEEIKTMNPNELISRKTHILNELTAIQVSQGARRELLIEEKTLAELLMQEQEQKKIIKVNQEIQEKIDAVIGEVWGFVSILRQKESDLKSLQNQEAQFRVGQCPILNRICADLRQASNADKIESLNKKITELKNIIIKKQEVEKIYKKELRFVKNLDFEIIALKNKIRDMKSCVTNTDKSLPELEQELAKFEDKIYQAMAAKQNQETRKNLTDSIDKITKIASDADMVYRLCAPDGLPAKYAESNKFLDLVNQSANMLFTGEFFSINSNFEPSMNGILHVFCSESEQQRMAMLFQHVFCQMAGHRLLVLDRLDIYRGIVREKVSEFISKNKKEYDYIICLISRGKEETQAIINKIKSGKADVIWL